MNTLTKFIISFLFPIVVSASPQKQDLYNYLGQLKAKSQESLLQTEKTIVQLINSTRTIHIDTTKEDSHTNLEQITRTIEQLISQKSEYLLRIDFLDRVILQIQKYYNSSNLKGLLEQRLLEMSISDLGIGSSDVQPNPQLAIFMTQLSVIIRESSEDDNNIIKLLENYMIQGIANPTPAEQFLHEQNYTNGTESYEASTAHDYPNEDIALPALTEKSFAGRTTQIVAAKEEILDESMKIEVKPLDDAKKEKIKENENQNYEF